MNKPPSTCTEKEWLDLLKDLYPGGEIKAMRRLWLELVTESAENAKTVQGDHHPCWKRLQQGEPIQYVLGKAFFMGLELSVTSAVLIPRPETEELVEWVWGDWAVRDSMLHGRASGIADFVDLGSGSGCIALALASKWDHVHILALDCEEQALQIVQHNAFQWGFSDRIRIGKANFMSSEWQAPEARFWISNPPYIAPEEASAMDKHVIDFEPSVALFAPGGQTVEVYRTLITAFQASITAECLWLELNPRYALDIVGLLDSSVNLKLPGPGQQEWGGANRDYEWLLRRDMQSQWRMLRIRRRNQGCTKTA